MRTMKTHRSKNGPNPKKHKPKPRVPKVDVRKKKTDPDKPPIPEKVASEGLVAIREAEEKLGRLEKDYEQAKVAGRKAKAAKEEAREELHRIIREETGLEPTLFNSQVRGEKSDIGLGGPVEGDDTWRDHPISDLTVDGKPLKGRIIKALAAAYITTLGDYINYVTPSAGSDFMPRLADIKGLGAEAITEFENAQEQFFAEHRQRLADANKATASKAVDTVAESTAMPAAEAQPSTNGTGHAEAETLKTEE